MKKLKTIVEENNRNIFTLLYIVVISIFIVIDSFQLFFYPLMMMGFLVDIRKIIYDNLPDLIKNIKLIIIFIVLIINVLIRIFSLIAILRSKTHYLIIALISNMYTIIIVAFILRSNFIWESITMILLSVILLIGEKRKKLTIASTG